MEPSRAPVMGATEWTLLLALSTIWGGSFFLGKVALSGLPPLTVALGRVGVAALALNLAVLTGAAGCLAMRGPGAPSSPWGR